MTARLFALRHGHSHANQQGVIASSLALAGNSYGLTPQGRAAVRRSIRDCPELGSGGVRIISSPLLRARESAQIAHEMLGGAPVEIDARLGERDFGELEGASDTRYAEIWAHDERDANRAPHGVEPAAQVRARVEELLAELRTAREPRDVLLVAHGDTIQILWTIVAGLGAGEHRHREPLQAGQLLALGAIAAR